MESLKDLFKALIREFHEGALPRVIKRRFWVSDCGGRGLADSFLMSPSIGVVAVTGPRRSGKTHFLYQLMESICGPEGAQLPRRRIIYLNLADDRLLPLRSSDVSSLLDAYFELYPDNRGQDLFVFLDEVAHIEGWELFVRGLLDQRNFKIFMSGSSSDITPRSPDYPHPGRTPIFKILPLSFEEYLAFKGIDCTQDSVTSELRYKIRFLLDEYLIFGGFPEVVLADVSSKLRILRDYFDIIVYRDMVERFGIRNIGLLKGLIKHLVSHMGSAVSLNAYYLGLRSNCRVSRDTVMEYVSHLEQEGLISLVPQFSESRKAQQVNPRKVFCLDNGLRNAVSFRLAEDEERLAKNAIFRALKDTGEPVYYWRDGGGVDFVTKGAGMSRSIVVSYGRALDPAVTKPLLALRRMAGKRNTDLAVITKDTEKTEGGINFVPLWKWLLAEQGQRSRAREFSAPI